MASFSRHVDGGLEGFGDRGQRSGEGGDRRVHAAGDVSGAHRRAGREDQPRRADRRGPRRLLRDGAERARVGRKGGSIAKTRVTATVTADKSDAGIKFTTSKLKVVAARAAGDRQVAVRRGRARSRRAAARSRTRCATICRSTSRPRFGSAARRRWASPEPVVSGFSRTAALAGLRRQPDEFDAGCDPSHPVPPIAMG